MDNYYDTQFVRMTEWIKLFQRMSSAQKIIIFENYSTKEAWYEGTVSEITFEDLTVFAEKQIFEISAKDGIIVITCENTDS